MFVEPDWLKVAKIDCFGTYSYFGHWRETSPDTIKNLYTGFAQQVHQAGKAVQLPFSPGHDNTAVNPEPCVIPRDDGNMLKNFLRAIDEAKPEIAVVCSFNEWYEMTQIEPSANWKDPYLYLKNIAQWRGKKWQTPPLPTAAKK